MDVIKFSQNKALECSRDNNLLDRDSARLLWDFIVLLCRQNGVSLGRCKRKQGGKKYNCLFNFLNLPIVFF